MTPLEIIAVIFAISVILKIGFAVFAPKWRIKKVTWFAEHPIVIEVLFGVCAVILAYFIFQELTIVHVVSAMVFTACLVGMVIFAYEDAFAGLLKGIPRSSEEILQRQWINILIWLFLAVWVLYSVFVLKSI